MKARLPRVQRILVVLEPVPLYEVVGKRPSAVFLDDALSPTSDPSAVHRLHEPVFRRTTATPGEEIHVTSGQTLLLDGTQSYRAVLLSEPQVLSPNTALVHAERIRRSEADLVERLIQAGKLVVATLRQPKDARLRPRDTLFDPDDPLVIATPPRRAPKRARAAGARRRR